MKGCFRALEPAVPNYITKLDAHVAQCDEYLLAERGSASSMPGVAIALFFFLFSSFLFFSLFRNHLPKGSVCISVSCVKKSFGALNHLFQSIAFELTISGRFVKKKSRRLSLNRIAKGEP